MSTTAADSCGSVSGPSEIRSCWATNLALHPSAGPTARCTSTATSDHALHRGELDAARHRSGLVQKHERRAVAAISQRPLVVRRWHPHPVLDHLDPRALEARGMVVDELGELPRRRPSVQVDPHATHVQGRRGQSVNAPA